MKSLEEAPLHSTLGRWMIQHREELEAMFRQGKPDWTAMAEHFGKAGLRDEAEHKPTAGSAERTWRVVQASGAVPSSAVTPKWRGYPAEQRKPRVGA